jgi:hypothetical protein
MFPANVLNAEIYVSDGRQSTEKIVDDGRVWGEENKSARRKGCIRAISGQATYYTTHKVEAACKNIHV